MKLYGDENNIAIKKELGQRLKDIRIAASLTQKELSVRAGISQRTVERAENGENVNIDALINIFRVLGLLSKLELLLPEATVTPVMRLHQIKKRKRATSREKMKPVDDWKWGDET